MTTHDEGGPIIKSFKGKNKIWPHGDITSIKVELKNKGNPNWEYVKVMDRA